MLERLRRFFLAPAKRSIEAAGAGPRTQGWTQTFAPAQAIQAAGPVAGARAQAARLNDPRIARLVDVLVHDLVGSGYVLRPKHPDKAVRQALVDRFARFEAAADVTGHTNLTGLVRELVRSMIVDGSGFARLVVVEDADNPLRLQVLDPNQVVRDSHPDFGNGHRLIDGVEVDPFGRPVAFHVLTDDWRAEIVRLPADEIVHLFDRVAPGQARGISWLTPALTTARELDAYKDALLTTARTGAMFAGTLRDIDGTGLGPADDQGDGSEHLQLVPGAILRLPHGKVLEFNEPPKLAETGAFVKAYLRDIAAAGNVTYEQLSGDYEGVTYSSLRAAQADHRRGIEQRQYSIIIPGLVLPIWRRFVQLAVIAGHFPGHTVEELLPVECLPPRFGYVNPRDEVEADIAAIGAGLKSREQVIAENGFDIEQIDAQLAADPRQPSEAPRP